MNKDSPIHRRDIFYRACRLSAIVLGLVLLAILVIQPAEPRVVILDLVSPFIDGFAAFGLFLAARSAYVNSKRLAVAWGTLGLSFFFYAIGDIIWAILEVGLKQQPFPSLADAFYLAYYPAFLAGVFLLQGRLAKPSAWINKAIDGTIIVLASTVAYWNFLIGPAVLANAGLPVLEQFILVAYPVGDLVLLAALLVILYNRSNTQDDRAIFLLAGSLVATIAGDSIYGYQSSMGTYASGGLLDLAWIISALLAGLAGISQFVALGSSGSISGRPARPIQIKRVAPFAPYLPYLWLAAALLMLFYGGLAALPMTFFSLSLFVGGIVALVLIRQMLTLLDNTRLNSRLTSTNRDLENEVAERKRIQLQLAHDSLHDAMTGLANRTLFMDRLGQALQNIKRRPRARIAVIFLDMDQFKVVNDSLGHLIGDRLVAAVANRVKQALRSSDTIARFGGDEFAVLLENIADDDTVLTVAEKIRRVVQDPIKLDQHEIFVTASIGITMNRPEHAHPEDMLRDADIAMFHAKSMGGGRCELFNVGMRTQAYMRLEMEIELRRALEQREFELFYQPIMSLEAIHLVGFEALIRWSHPKRGRLLPGEFLPIAEDSGLILPIGDWVLTEACRQMKAWQEKYPHLRTASISVNIAGKQLSQPDFRDKVVKALAESGLDADSLRLEITEGVLIKNYSTATLAFAELRDLGVQMQIDDFGTGYSALGYLQQFPINAIKIDRVFIGEMGRSQKGTRLVRAIVSMARELGMETIAEGIETGEQLSDLQSLLVGYGQGFLLSKPLDVGAAETVLAGIEKGQ